MVGKLEKDIPEDDPRNPGVIADAVGDNVGDVAGMGSDIFESYCGAIIATMAIAATGISEFRSLPLFLVASGLLCTVLGILVFRFTKGSDNPASAMTRAMFVSTAVFIVVAYFVILHLQFPVSINSDQLLPFGTL